MPLYNPVAAFSTGGQFLQTAYAAIAADSTTSSGTFVAIGTGLSVTITTVAGSFIDMWFTASSSHTANSGAEIDFQLLVDGVSKIGCGTGTKSTSIPQSAQVTYRQTGLTAGSHTITIQWRQLGAANQSAQIRPVTTIIECATLRIAEII